MKIWVKTDVAPEGKYLVVRRDGTIPNWPHFVLGGDDPNSPAGLRGYADKAEENGLDPEYVASIREQADEWESRCLGKSDPDAPPHRKDNPMIVAMMRKRGADLSRYGMIQEIEDAIQNVGHLINMNNGKCGKAEDMLMQIMGVLLAVPVPVPVPVEKPA